MVLVWKPITDLPEDWSSLTDGELKPLLQFWNDQRADLEQSRALAAFSERLAREWSIETGQIEGVYHLDRGITQTLIEKGINSDLIPAQPGQKSPELIAAIIQDHASVLEGLFQFVRGERPLSRSYIHELHVALMKHQDTTVVRDQFGELFESKLLKGKYKERPNNPRRADGTVYEFCPPEQVESEMERLLAMHAKHEKLVVPVEVEAAWLHHRFTQIHPYQDGNGRVARALASLLFIKAGWFPVVVSRDDRPRYLDALEVGDQGVLLALVSLLVDIQKRALFQAVQTAADVQQARTVEEAIGQAKRALTEPARSVDPRWLMTKQYASRLMDIAAKRLASLAESLTREIGESRSGFKFGTDGSSWAEVGTLLPYKPNTIEYESGRKLVISAERLPYTEYIEVNAHAIGSKFSGLIGIVTVFWKGRNSLELASKNIFQLNYAEPRESAECRFRPWLEESLVNALTLWRKSL
jgi:fido (protein-threonine AMPylation protein)